MAERPTTTLVAFTVSESATEPEVMVRVVEGEVRTTGVAEVKMSGAAWVESVKKNKIITKQAKSRWRIMLTLQPRSQPRIRRMLCQRRLTY